MCYEIQKCIKHYEISKSLLSHVKNAYLRQFLQFLLIIVSMHKTFVIKFPVNNFILFFEFLEGNM